MRAITFQIRRTRLSKQQLQQHPALTRVEATKARVEITKAVVDVHHWDDGGFSWGTMLESGRICWRERLVADTAVSVRGGLMLAAP